MNLLVIGSTSVLFSQFIEFSFGNYVNSFEVPADTHWRKYDIPMDILVPNDLPYIGEARFSLKKRIAEGEPDSCAYWLDRLHFPSNSFEFFEDTSEAVLSLFSGQGNTLDYEYSSNTPDSSDFSLSFHCTSETDSLLFDIWVSDPLYGYPVIPDTVGFYMKAQTSADLQRFIPLDVGNVWQWENPSLGNFRVSELLGGASTDSTRTYKTNEWSFREDEVTLTHRVYMTDINHPTKVFEIYPEPINYTYVWDFGLLPGEYLPYEPMYPVEEYFSTNLGLYLFTKKYEPQDWIYYQFHKFAYGLGMTEHYQIFGDHEYLTAARTKNRLYGDSRFENTISFGFDREPWITDFYRDIKTFPDTSWVQYKIPLSELLFTIDSTDYVRFWVFILTPAFFIRDYHAEYIRREILVDEIKILSYIGEPPFIIDTFDSGIDGWDFTAALDGSWIEFDTSTDTPSGDGFNLIISFGNGMGQSVTAWAYTSWDSTLTPEFHRDDTLSLWVKEIPQTAGVDGGSHPLPDKFILYQNYPNPFNPVTTIRFDLPEAGEVELVIYDILGREVETLVSSWRLAGQHNVVWNASDVTSGVYFYRLVVRQSAPPESQRRAGSWRMSYTETKKLIVLK